MADNKLNHNDNGNNSNDNSREEFNTAGAGLKSIFAKYKKFIAAGTMLALLAVVIASTRSLTKDPGASSVNAENKEAGIKNEEFEVDAYPEVNALFDEYYSAYAAGDTDTIEKIAYPITETEKSYIKLFSQYIESFDNIKCYTKKGIDKDEYIVSVTAETKFKDIKTGAPGLEGFYIRKDKKGVYYIDNTYSRFNQEDTTGDKVTELIAEYKEAEDFSQLEDQAQKDYEKALDSDEDLDEMLSVTVQGAISGWVASFDSSGKSNGEETAVRTGRTNTGVNMRAKRSTDSDIVQTLKENKKVTIYGESKNGWLKVKAKGKTGYIKEEYIEIEDTGSDETGSDKIDSNETGTNTGDKPEGGENETTRVGHTNTSVNMRAKRSTNSDVVQTLKANKQVTVYGESKNGWLRVKAKGKTGYIKEEYIDFDDAKSDDDENSTQKPNNGSSTDTETRTGYTTTQVNMRAKRSTNSDVVQTLKADKQVTVYGKSKNGWLKVKAKGKTGYIKEDYITFDAGGSNKGDDDNTNVTTRTAYAKTEVNMRKKKSTDSRVVQTLKAGAKVTIYGKSESGWFKVKVKGRTGYVKKEYIVSSKSKVKKEDSGGQDSSPAYYTEGDRIRLTQSVNIRESMSESSDIAALAYEGEVVTVIMSYAEGWTKVSYDGKTGYVKTDVLK